ncbi:MAG: Hemolysin A [Phycisphaerae bacterium]|nr:Hemolysin A [Phycisphaerae bacterium]
MEGDRAEALSRGSADGDATGPPYASRGGLKLAAALDAFRIDPSGVVCLDLGSHAGGFVDCLLRRGAARVHAVDTGYGVLDYRLRRDPRVVVHERQNALTFVCAESAELVTIDVGWTPQRLVLTAARRSLASGGGVITLIKPHYEAPRDWLRRGVLPAERLEPVLEMCRGDIRDAGWRIRSEVASPITGHAGNVEWLMHLEWQGGAAVGSEIVAPR